MHVLFHDIETKLSLGNARTAISLDDLLAQSDVVTLHVPETAATKDMFGAAQIAKLKRGAHAVSYTHLDVYKRQLPWLVIVSV